MKTQNRRIVKKKRWKTFTGLQDGTCSYYKWQWHWQWKHPDFVSYYVLPIKSHSPLVTYVLVSPPLSEFNFKSNWKKQQENVGVFRIKGWYMILLFLFTVQIQCCYLNSWRQWMVSNCNCTKLSMCKHFWRKIYCMEDIQLETFQKGLRVLKAKM